MPRTILYVRGFEPSTRARDLAYEFERYGTLVRCDIPAPRGHPSSAAPYAFVEFRSARDASAAFEDMHGRHFEGRRLTVEWAKRLPSSMWRSGGGRSPPPRRSRYRSRSPRRDRDDKDDRRRRSRSRSRDRRDDDRGRERDDVKPRRRSESPNGRRRSFSRGSDKAGDRDREIDLDPKKENGVELDNTPALSEA